MSHAVLHDILERRLAQKRFRHLQPFTSRPLIDPELNFAHQDLFFLSGHDYIKRKAIEAVGKWGSGFHHTRILLSQLEAQRKVEERLAALLHKKHVFLFNSAESMHESLLSALNHPKMELYIDKYFPLVKGQKKGNTHLFDHDKVLPKTATGKAIVTTTLSSLTGEFWKEKQILDKAKEQDVVFYVDDSLAFGIYGQLGLG
ncbi:MAG: hypothetical protein FJZ56_03290, partial [Chlamydiae bacterium]|nr:hypothetical protein [Chlamydiota bacterium]